MHEQGMAKDLWPQLRAIADNNGFTRVTYIEMVVGLLHGVSGDALTHGLEHAFQETNFHGADVEVTIVAPGEEFDAPGRNDTQTASGWELLIVKMQGEKR